MSDTPRTDMAKYKMRDVLGGLIDVVPVRKSEELERELTALRSSQMTETKAREVLGNWIRDDGSLDVVKFTDNSGEYIYLDDIGFTALQLRAIAWWMQNMGGESNG